jgi:hypothetical protein
MRQTSWGMEDSKVVTILATSIPQAPTFSLATLRTVLAELTERYPQRAGRLVKAANIVAVRSIAPVYGIGWLVSSEVDADKTYWVQPVDALLTCDCMDFRQRGGPCKHGLAVELFTACERRDAEQADPTIGSNIVPFPEQPAYSDEDRFELTPLGMQAAALVPAGA